MVIIPNIPANRVRSAHPRKPMIFKNALNVFVACASILISFKLFYLPSALRGLEPCGIHVCHPALQAFHRGLCTIRLFDVCVVTILDSTLCDFSSEMCSMPTLLGTYRAEFSLRGSLRSNYQSILCRLAPPQRTCPFASVVSVRRPYPVISLRQALRLRFPLP